MSDEEREDPVGEEPGNGDEDRPSGAIFVTAFLAVVILVGWFAVFALYSARS